MRRWKIILGVTIAVLVAGLAWIVLPRLHTRECRLEDGSVLRLERVTFGHRDMFIPVGIVDRLKGLLPASWTARFVPSKPLNSRSWWMNTDVHTNTAALNIWLTRKSAGSRAWLGVDIGSAELLDEHGCVFLETQSGGEDHGQVAPASSGAPGSMTGYGVEWFVFEAFPRHEKTFRLHLYDQQGQLIAEFIVTNPALVPLSATNWVTEPLPITKREGDLAFTLAKLNVRTNAARSKPGHGRPGNPREIKPVFEVLDHGAPSKDWTAVQFDLYDGSGNFASPLMNKSRWLCPRELAWKLSVKFCGSQETHSASNALWTLGNLPVPAPGTFEVLSGSRDLQGVTVKALALAGRGTVIYSNDVPIQASTNLVGRKNAYPYEYASKQNGPGTSYTQRTVKLADPNIVLSIGSLSDDQRASVRAVDDQGRVTYAHEWIWNSSESKRVSSEPHYLERSYGENQVYLMLDLAADAKTVEVTICIHNASIQEFICQPPRQEVVKE